MELNTWTKEYINDERTRKLFDEWSYQIDLKKIKKIEGEKEREIGRKIGEKIGERNGIKIGERNKTIEFAKALIAKDVFTINEISEITNLSPKEIKKLV